MARFLDKQKYKCAMGAMLSVQAIERGVPVLHASGGCASKLSIGSGTSGYISPLVYPTTWVNEHDVVFGGSDRLRETIDNALKIIDGDIFFVLSGCSQEIVGDDIEEVVSDFSDASKPVLYVHTPGFRGNNYLGHEWVVQSLIDQYLRPAGHVVPGSINIWGPVPFQNDYWHGDLRALEGLVRSLGLSPNTIFGHRRGIENIDRIPEAQLNVLVGPWVGLSNMDSLKERFGTPFLHFPNLPIGATETSKFLRAVGQAAGVDRAVVSRAIEEGESEYYYYIERYVDMFNETRSMSRRFSVVGDAYMALAITKFMVNDLGIHPATQYLADDAPKRYRQSITDEFRNLNFGLKAPVRYEVDGYLVHEDIKNSDYNGYPMIFGSYWEKALTQELGGHFIECCFPVFERQIINKTYAGYAGGLSLIEDIYSVVKQHFD